MAQRELNLTFEAVTSRNSIILVRISIDSSWLANCQLGYFLRGRLRRALLRLSFGHHLDVDEDAVACFLAVRLIVVMAGRWIGTATSEGLQTHIQAEFVFLQL